MDPDHEAYRRRQRRRAIIGWTSPLLIVAVVALAVAFGGEDEHTTPTPSGDVFSAEMSSSQYLQIHKGQNESLVIDRLGSTGLQEDEVEAAELQMFPAPPADSTCSFWTLSDAPEHTVRLCFSDPQGVLLQKSVHAPGEGGVETTLV